PSDRNDIVAELLGMGSRHGRHPSSGDSHRHRSGDNQTFSSPAYDNALMECVIGLYKTECIRTTVFHTGPYRTIADVEYATAGWVDWYNNRRLHGTLGMMSPVEYEQDHYATLNREPHPA
ncbi:integrase core domain-containing protein, partial [Nocardioides currus]|uniref:integrase core domain-containing protein n=1 Tax=Nocardioides currus TaxID=2133958 RepID=UPI003C6E795B